MRVRVLTLNAWNLPFGLARDAAARIEAIGQALEGLTADVLTLQEVWTRRGRAQLVQAGARAGYPHAWHRPAALGGSGLLVLSRWPIREPSFLRYRPAGLPQRVQHADYYGGKGLALLVLEPTGGRRFALATTHLHADYVARDDHDEYLATRIAQIVQLSHALLPVDLPLIASGDWNTEEGDVEYDVLLGLSGMTDVAAAVDARQDTIVTSNPYHGAKLRGQRIDMILSRDGADEAVRPLSIRRVLDGPLRGDGSDARYSDHAGLLAELEIEPRSASESGAASARVAPDPGAVARASALLDTGSSEAQARRTSHRRVAVAGLGLGMLGVATTRGAAGERRGFLGMLLLTLSSTALGVGLGAGWLSERFAADELEGFAETVAALHELRAASGAGAKVTHP